MSFSIGEKVKMTKDALDNYGQEYAEKILIIESKANKYMCAEQFFAKGKPEGYHPGYDNAGMPGVWLYDCEGLTFSLYDWELERA